MQTEKVVDFIVNWLKDYATNAGVNGFVVGISGGIDSAVTSTLCAKTGLNVLCIEMPIHQAKSHVTRAQEHISLLKSRYSNIDDTRTDLTPVFEEFKTEVFFEAVADCLRAGRQAVILLPEIALTHTFLKRFEDRFGARPGEWHSDMTPVQRARMWRSVARGKVQAVVGARSALFLPSTCFSVRCQDWVSKM